MSEPKPFFQNENVTLYQGDNRKVLPFIEPGFDLLLTDPPYGINADKEASKNNGKWGWKYYGETSWDSARPAPWVLHMLLEKCKGHIIWGGNYFADVLPATQGWVVWNKMQRDFSLADGELAWCSFDKALRIADISRAQAMLDVKQHPCLRPGSEVLTDAGWKKVETILPGVKVLTASHGFQPVENVSSHHCDGPLYKVCVDGDFVDATWNHPFLLLRGNVVAWVLASQIIPGDLILTPISCFGTLKPCEKEKAEPLHKKDTSESCLAGFQDLLTSEHGSEPMALFLPDSKSITRMGTSKTIACQTSKFSVHLCTSGFTPVAKLLTGSGGSHALNAWSLNPQLRSIGISREGSLPGKSVESASLQKLSPTGEFALREVGAVKKVGYSGEVWNLTVASSPTFQTRVGMSHNTQKPVKLMTWCLVHAARAMEQPIKTVLDPFAGSGTTLVACHQLGIKCVGIEMNPVYCDIIVDRLKQDYLPLNTAPETKPVETPELL